MNKCWNAWTRPNVCLYIFRSSFVLIHFPLAHAGQRNDCDHCFRSFLYRTTEFEFQICHLQFFPCCTVDLMLFQGSLRFSDSCGAVHRHVPEESIRPAQPSPVWPEWSMLSVWRQRPLRLRLLSFQQERSTQQVCSLSGHSTLWILRDPQISDVSKAAVAAGFHSNQSGAVPGSTWFQSSNTKNSCSTAGLAAASSSTFSCSRCLALNLCVISCVGAERFPSDWYENHCSTDSVNIQTRFSFYCPFYLPFGQISTKGF